MERSSSASLGGGILFYFNSLKFGYPQYYHRWDQYHYYMGAKYFPEIKYDGLYKCTAIAQADVGKIEVDVEGNGKKRTFDLGAEVKKPDKKIRNLSGDNSLMKVDDLLATRSSAQAVQPGALEQYKRTSRSLLHPVLPRSSDQMQQDHGYNPPPVWTIAATVWVPVQERRRRDLRPPRRGPAAPFMQGLR